MDLRLRINEALKTAMRTKDQTRLSTLRLIMAAIKDRDIARRAEGGDDADAGVGETDVQGILAKMVKQRQESARAYEEGGRLELAEQERKEIEIIEDFLPRQLDEDETDAAIDAAIKSTDASSIRDMGKVMGELKTHYTGQMDFTKAGPKVKARLG